MNIDKDTRDAIDTSIVSQLEVIRERLKNQKRIENPVFKNMEVIRKEPENGSE